MLAPQAAHGYFFFLLGSHVLAEHWHLGNLLHVLRQVGVLFAILHVWHLLAHVLHRDAFLAQRHVRYLLSEGLVLGHLGWQLLDSIVDTTLSGPHQLQGNGNSHCQQLCGNEQHGHHIQISGKGRRTGCFLFTVRELDFLFV